MSKLESSLLKPYLNKSTKKEILNQKFSSIINLTTLIFLLEGNTSNINIINFVLGDLYGQ